MKFGLPLYFLVFSILFVFIVPVFEAPDEPAHLANINYYAAHRALPNQYIKEQTASGEGQQPPLYYVLASSFNRLFKRDRTVALAPRDNKLHIYGGGGDPFVPRYNNLSDGIFAGAADRYNFYALRLFSSLLSLLTLYYIYKIAGLFFGDPLGRLLPVLIAATLPQFLFMSGMINNDSLANLLAAVCIYYSFKILAAPQDAKAYLWLGIGFGLGLLTKITLLVLLPGTLALVLYLIYKEREARPVIIKYSLMFLVIVVLLCGWWFARNHALYGDLLGRRMEMKMAANLVEPKSILDLVGRHQFFTVLFFTFIGVFGWLGLILPLGIYLFYAVLMTAAAGGLYYSLKRSRWRHEKIYLSLLFVFLNLCGIAQFNLTFTSIQGRLMFPTLALIAVLLTYGLKEILGRIKAASVQRALVISLVLIFCAVDVASLIATFLFYHSPANYL